MHFPEKKSFSLQSGGRSLDFCDTSEVLACVFLLFLFFCFFVRLMTPLQLELGFCKKVYKTNEKSIIFGPGLSWPLLASPGFSWPLLGLSLAGLWPLLGLSLAGLGSAELPSWSGWSVWLGCGLSWGSPWLGWGSAELPSSSGWLDVVGSARLGWLVALAGLLGWLAGLAGSAGWVGLLARLAELVG